MLEYRHHDELSHRTLFRHHKSKNVTELNSSDELIRGHLFVYDVLIDL